MKNEALVRVWYMFLVAALVAGAVAYIMLRWAAETSERERAVEIVPYSFYDHYPPLTAAAMEKAYVRFVDPPTKTPKPTKTAKPTKTPKPTRTPKPTKTPKIPCDEARAITDVVKNEYPKVWKEIERKYPGLFP